jgi:hypothetical protein
MGDEFMAAIDKTNPVRQNTRLKQYLGWALAIIFPFAARGIVDITRIPLVAALIYWLICGILLRYTLQKNLPYFKPGFKDVEKEIVVLGIATGVSVYLYILGVNAVRLPLRELLLNTIFFAMLNGVFEQLVWTNIYDLAGCKVKLMGSVAVLTYIILTQWLFWGQLIPSPQVNTSLFMISQTVMFLIPLLIYRKTRDLTIWSIQRILYNIVLIYFGGFGISMFIQTL